MASQGLKRKAEVLSALVDQIYGELGTPSTTSKRFRTGPDTLSKSKNDLLKDFSVQHLEFDSKKIVDAHQSPLPIPDVVDETPVVLDREAFLKRLQTYSALFTYGKPITPVECASHGWIDTRDHGLDLEVSKLRCELCSGVVYVTNVKHGVSEELLRSIREKYLKGLSELHEKNCIWKYSECDDWIYSFPFFTSYDAIRKWQDQVFTLVTKNVSLPLVTSPLTTENLAMMKKLLKLELELSNEDKPIDWLQHKNLDSAMVLPLFGWTFFEIEGRSALKCELCFRALGLWAYNYDGVSLTTGYASSIPLDSIDAEKEHRHYCPYINRKQAQITTAATSRHSTNDSGQAICGWEFMLDMATIESKHLEEMYDLSPKAEQQRTRLRQEAQDLMKAAKSRLSQVLSGSWMKQSISTPEVEVFTEQNESVRSPVSPTQVSPVKECEQILPSIIISQEEKQALSPAADLSDRITDENGGINMDVTTGEDTSEDVHALGNVSEQLVEIPEEVAAKVEVSLEGVNTLDNLVKLRPQFIEASKSLSTLASPGSSLDVNLSTASSPNEIGAEQQLRDDQLEDEAKTTESETYQNGEEEEVDQDVAEAPSSNVEKMTNAMAGHVEASPEIASVIATPSETPEAQPIFDDEIVSEQSDEAVNTSISIEEGAVEDDDVPVEDVEGTLSVQDSAIEDIDSNLKESEASLEEQVDDASQLDQSAAQELQQEYDEHGSGEQDEIEQESEAAEIEDSLDTEANEIEIHQTEDEDIQGAIDSELSADTPKAEAVVTEVEVADDYNFEEAEEEVSADMPSAEVDELGDDGIADEQTTIAEEEEKAEEDRIMDEVEELENTNAVQQNNQIHLEGETDLGEESLAEGEPAIILEQDDTTMHEEIGDNAEEETLAMVNVNSPFSPLPYEEEEEEEEEKGVPQDEDMKEEDDQTADIPAASISDMDQDAGDENMQAENEIDDNLVEEGTTSEQLEQDFATYIEEEPQANEEQAITSNEQEVADELQASLEAGMQDDEADDDVADNSDEHVLVEKSVATTMTEDQEITEAPLDLEAAAAEDESAVDIDEDTEVEVSSAAGGEAAATESSNVIEVEQQHEAYEEEEEEIAEVQQAQQEEVQDYTSDVIEDVSSPHISTSQDGDANESIEDTKASDVSTDDAAISDQAAQDIGELNAEIEAAENDVTLPTSEEPPVEPNGTPDNENTEAPEPFITIEEDDVQQTNDEEYEVISTDDLPVLHTEESAESHHPEVSKVSLEVEGNAIVELPESPTTAQAQQDTAPPLLESADNAVDETEENQTHQHLLDNDQLEEYVDNEQLGEYLEEQPPYTPEPESTNLDIIPASHIDAVDQASTPQLINDDDGDEVQEDDNVMDAFTTADQYEQHAMLDLEQPIEGAEDTVVSEPVSEPVNAAVSQDDTLIEDANTIESELHDSIMETEEDYTQESSMLDVE
ncbi:hypothetical protein BC943DRAFT_350020 [Umbelopsis sp. AD052]|nr:hypothetical protein BC943DRAFT_350020 [Umbelopsis sp. AD052]